MIQLTKYILESINKIYANMIVISPDNEILILRRSNYMKKFKSLWGFPGGSVENKDKDNKAAAIRELKEETGCVAEKMLYLGKINPNPAFMTNHFHVFAAFDLKETGSQNLDSDEYLNYLEMPKNEVYEKMGTPQMPHALMCSALMLFRQAEDSGSF